MTAEKDDPAAAARTERRVTSTDVARVSGVSRATVSYVLNNRLDKRVSAETREHVSSTARRLGYVPDASARALRRGRSSVVLGLVPSFNVGNVFDEMLESLSETLSRHGYVILLHRLAATEQSPKAIRDLWTHLNPTAVAVLGGSQQQHLVSLINETVRTRVVSDATLIDHRQIGRLQGEYLISKGHRRIVFAAPPNSDLHTIARERARGLRQACFDHGLPEPSTQIMSSDLSDTVVAVSEWVDPACDVTAICCHNDDTALRILIAVRELGLSEGHDLALIGVDNTPPSQIGLTTVSIDPPTVGRHLANQLLELLGHGTAEPLPLELMHVITRHSA